MANTFELIASKSVPTDGTSSISFTSIASTWTDLVLKGSCRDTSNGIRNLEVWFNSNTSSYSGKVLYGTGSATGSASISTVNIGINEPNDYTANTFTNFEIYVPNYAGSNNKSFSGDFVNENNATAAYATLNAALWSNTAAITSISIRPEAGTGSFATYSTFYLYGVKNA